MSSLSDILTAAKNIVTALNGAAQTYLNVQGVRNTKALSSAEVVQLGAGRLCSVSVVVAGSSEGAIYDATSSGSTTDKVYLIPKVHGVYFVNMPITNGIVVAPGTGQTVMISYS